MLENKENKENKENTPFDGGVWLPGSRWFWIVFFFVMLFAIIFKN